MFGRSETRLEQASEIREGANDLTLRVADREAQFAFYDLSKQDKRHTRAEWGTTALDWPLGAEGSCCTPRLRHAQKASVEWQDIEPQQGRWPTKPMICSCFHTHRCVNCSEIALGCPKSRRQESRSNEAAARKPLGEARDMVMKAMKGRNGDHSFSQPSVQKGLTLGAWAFAPSLFAETENRSVQK